MNEEMHGQSLDLNEIMGDSLMGSVQRKHFRIPLNEKEEYTVVINGIVRSLIDISANGICVGMQSGEVMDAGSNLADCELRLKGAIISGLMGEIVHCSLSKDMRMVCGIHWINLDSRVEKQLTDIVAKFRKELFQFSSSDTDSDSE